MGTSSTLAIAQLQIRMLELEVCLQDFLIEEEGARTTCLVCKRRGSGWEITEIRTMPNIHLAKDVMESGTVEGLKYTSLTKWRMMNSNRPLTKGYLHWGPHPEISCRSSGTELRRLSPQS